MPRHDLLLTTKVAGAAIAAYRIVKFGDADGKVVQAEAAADALIGIVNRVPAESGRPVEINRYGVAEVEYGGGVTRGDALTSDADGKAVTASRPAHNQTLVDGGAAGDITVTGITAADELVSVLAVDTGANEDFSDVTSEFSISAAGTINNTDGTATTGKGLLVTWRGPGINVIGFAEVSGVSGDIGSALIAPGRNQ